MLLELLLAASNCVPPRTSEVVGLWEFVPPRGHDGIEHAIELRADGTFIEARTVMLDGRYRVSGDVLTVMYESATDERRAKATPFNVTAKTLIGTDLKCCVSQTRPRARGACGEIDFQKTQGD